MSWLEANPLWALGLALAAFVGMPVLRAFIEAMGDETRSNRRRTARHEERLPDYPPPEQPPVRAAGPPVVQRSVVPKPTLTPKPPMTQVRKAPRPRGVTVATPSAPKGKRRRKKKPGADQMNLPGVH